MSFAPKYSPLLNKVNAWPLVKLTKLTKNIQRTLIDRTLKKWLEGKDNTAQSLYEGISTIIQKEYNKFESEPWNIDQKTDQPFWQKITSDFSKIKPSNYAELQSILKVIVTYYSQVIPGNFSSKAYRFASWFNRILLKTWLNPLGKFDGNRFQILGEVEKIRQLYNIGTLVFVPMHWSNIDSMLINLMMNNIGLPPPLFAAGLNLYQSSFIGTCMDRLGVYKVDRRNKSSVYLTALTNYYMLTLKMGCNSVFYPRGGRGRSGHIENKLKLGLLSSTIEAQYESLNERPIFIVPVSLSYSCVPEAAGLVKHYFIEEEQIKNIHFPKLSSFKAKFKFLKNLLINGGRVVVTLAPPMDVAGNEVNEKGNSLSASGEPVILKEYLRSIAASQQKKLLFHLQNKIIDAYKKNFCILPSQVIAYAAFDLINDQYPSYTTKELFSLVGKAHLKISVNTFSRKAEEVRHILFQSYTGKKLQLHTTLHRPLTNNSIHEAINELNAFYHIPLLIKKDNYLIINDLMTIWYYYNTINDYGIKKHST